MWLLQGNYYEWLCFYLDTLEKRLNLSEVLKCQFRYCWERKWSSTSSTRHLCNIKRLCSSKSDPSTNSNRSTSNQDYATIFGALQNKGSKFLFVVSFAKNYIQQPTIPQGLTEFIVNAYVDLRKESREFTSGICYNYYFIPYLDGLFDLLKWIAFSRWWLTILPHANFGPNAHWEFTPHFIVFEWQLGNMKKPVRYFQFYVFLHQLQNSSCLTL